MPPNPNEKPSTSKGIPPQYDELDKDESDDALLNVSAFIYTNNFWNFSNYSNYLNLDR